MGLEFYQEGEGSGARETVLSDGSFRALGREGNILISWKDAGLSQHYLLRKDRSCRMGGRNGVGFSWSSYLGWEGRLENNEGNLVLTTFMPNMVRDLG